MNLRGCASILECKDSEKKKCCNIVIYDYITALLLCNYIFKKLELIRTCIDMAFDCLKALCADIMLDLTGILSGNTWIYA